MIIPATLKNLIEAAGFEHYGVTPLGRPLTMDLYRAWLDEGLNASMKYLSEHLDYKADPAHWRPTAKTALVIAKPYFPHPYPAAKKLSVRTALYAQGEDYHLRFLQELNRLADKMRGEYPDEEFLCFTDAAPILERDLAYRAGLGWVGKNTCLIHPERGSLFVLGQILTSLEFGAETSGLKDLCGACDKCIRACPTGALETRRLDANLCISYWTVEADADAAPPLREKIGDWFFGCDICQTVCPWNEKHHGRDLLRSLTSEQPRPLPEELRWILDSSNKQLEKEFARSPLIRARARGLKRNALRLVGHFRFEELRTQVERHLADLHLGEIARWALERIS